jgi:hypothetical protein
MLQMGELYRHLKKRYGDQIELEVIDPRNQISYTSILIREVLRNHLGWKTFYQSMTKGLNTMAVLVNGQLISYGEIPDSDTVCFKIEECLNQTGKEVIRNEN